MRDILSVILFVIMQNNMSVKIGLWGGDGGQPRDIAHPPSTLVRVEVRSGAAIDAIKFTYKDVAGNLQEEAWGGLGGNANQPVLESAKP